MPSQLFLHCGPPKTGTSAIQAVLRDTPPPGLCYPETGQWPDGAHHKLAFALQGRKRYGPIDIPPWDALAPDVIAELNGAIARGDNVVISSELLPPDLATRLLDRLLPRLDTPFDAVSVLVTLRHPLERAASSYNQQIKDQQIDEKRMPNTFLKEAGPQFRLMPLIRTWQATPLAVGFVNYHPASDLVTRFFDRIGYPGVRDQTPARQRNASMNGYALATLLCARRLGLDTPDREQLFANLRRKDARNIWTGPSFPFASAPVARFLDSVVTEDLDAVHQETGIEIPRLSETDRQRFTLDTEQRAEIRTHFDAFDLTPSQSSRLDQMLDRLS